MEHENFKTLQQISDLLGARGINPSGRQIVDPQSEDQHPVQEELFSRYVDHPLRLHVLGSGSKGNAAVISSSEGSILIDAGFSAKEICARLNAVSLEYQDIKAIVLTHEHSDHIGGVGPVARRLGVEVYGTRGTITSSSFRRQSVDALPIAAYEEFSLAGITVLPFSISHDAAEPVGYRFSLAGDSIGYMTDTGIVLDQVKEALQDVRILALESNHDPRMLAVGPYPYILKERISSDRGHLSNDQAAQYLVNCADNSLERVVAMHLSETNNMPLLSEKALVEALRSIDHPATIQPAGQNIPRTCEAQNVDI